MIKEYGKKHLSLWNKDQDENLSDDELKNLTFDFSPFIFSTKT